MRRWPFALLALTLLWFFPWQEHLNNPNENVRIYLTRALVEHGTVAIGWRVRQDGRLVDRGSVTGEWGWVNDKALVCDRPGEKPPCTGRLLAAKAPGLSLLAVPPYALLSAAHRLAGHGPPGKGLTVRVLRLALVTVPWLLFLFFLGRFLLRMPGVDGPGAELAVLALGLGSIATPYAMIFAGHTPAAIALGGALLALHGAGGRAGHCVLGGLLLALAPAIEYPMALPAGLLGACALATAGPGRRAKTAGWLALGGAAPLAGVCAYQAVALGHPLATPYAFLENAAFIKDSAAGLHGIALPGLQSLGVGLLSPEAGLLFFMPAAALAPLGVALLVRDPRPGQRGLGVTLLLALAAFVYLLAAMPNLRRMLGWTVGPRYIAGIGPFLAVALARAASWLRERWPGGGLALAAALALAGLVLCGVPALLYPHYPMSFRNPSFQLGLPLLVEGYLPYSLGTALGLRGWPAAAPGLLAAAGVALALLLPARATRPGPAAAAGAGPRRWPGGRPGQAALALVLAALLLAMLSLPGRRPLAAERKDAAWVRSHWQPAVAARGGVDSPDEVRGSSGPGRAGKRDQAARSGGSRVEGAVE